MSTQAEVSAAEFYKGRSESRTGPVSQDPAAAARYYDRYVRFVSEYMPKGGALLELGSATGMAASCLSAAGYRTTATDIAHAFFRGDLRTPMLRFAAADTGNLPFGDATFDGVASFQTLEHAPDPKRALDEMLRVVKPGGWIFVAGPNLLGLVPSLHLLLYVIPRYRPVRSWFRRDVPHVAYPFGSTYPEVVAILFKNIWRIVGKLVDRDVSFLLRSPDYQVPMLADADSTYLLNPIDIVKYLRSHACTIRSSRGRGTFGILGPFAGGTWVAARKDS